MELGTVAHKMVLGSGPEIVVVDAANWMTKAAKEQRDAARLAGKVPLLPDDYQRAKAMADAVLSHPLAGALFNPDHGSAERSLFWEDPLTGVMLRLPARLAAVPRRSWAAVHHRGPEKLRVR